MVSVECEKTTYWVCLTLTLISMITMMGCHFLVEWMITSFG